MQAALEDETSIVHDLRNPLSAIHGSAEILINSHLSQPQVHRIARNMYGASVRMKELLDEFLSRRKTPHRVPEPCSLAELVDSAVAKVETLAEAQAVEIFGDVPAKFTVAADRHRIQRVLVNLLLNAIEVMPDGGVIAVSAVPAPHRVVIRVRDTGPGIAPEIRARLFEPFVTAGKSGGLGLGLALSKQAIAEHGGAMWSENLDHGACIAFSLPLTQTS
jgi:two-component system, NtrC family, sensor histidine kinase HydH